MFALAASVAILCASYFLQAAFAFGGPLLATPLLSLVISPKAAVALTTIFSILGSFLLVKLWKYIEWSLVRAIMPGLFVGLCFGLAIFVYISAELLMVLMALYILFHVTNDHFKLGLLKSFSDKLSARAQGWLNGFAAGFIQGATGIGGGPPVAIYIKKYAGSVDGFRGAYMFVWLIGNLFRLAFISQVDLLAPQTVQIALYALPLFILATIAGYRMTQKMDLTRFHHDVNALLLLSALSILYKSFG